MKLVFLLLMFGSANAAAVDPVACVLKTVCPSVHPKVHHKPKPPVAVISHDSMCWEFPLTIIREPVTVPEPEVVPVAVAEPDMPTFNLPEDTNVFADIGNTVGGWFDSGPTGGGYIPHRGGYGMSVAPELDPSAGMSAVLLLSGALAILRGSARAKEPGHGG